MAKDAELDRLKSEQDDAFRAKQSAYQASQASWQRRVAARDTMNAAFDAKSRTWEAQDLSWRALQRLRDTYGPQIESLNAQQEAAFNAMRSAFESASSAYDRKDGVAASSYANEGRRHQADSRSFAQQRRVLVAELKSAKERHETVTQLAFQRAKTEANNARSAFDRAKAEHEQAQAVFKKAKERFDNAVKAFQKRLEEVKSQTQSRKQGRRAIAEQAGVPYQYLDDIWVSTDASGTSNIYFGGVGAPNGLGHGHYAMKSDGTVTYRRNPFDPHGAHNFTEPLYWHKEKMSLDLDTGTFQTDNYIGIIGSTHQKSKAHVAVDENGDIVFVRDIGGEILYSKKDGIGRLPRNLDWSN